MSELWKGDFHCHTAYSPCSNLTLERLAALCEKHGLNVLAVTDHDTIDGALRFRSLVRFPVIIGEEITSSAGHVIGYFLKERIPPGLNLAETIERVHAQGGIASIPHPFDALLPARRTMTEDALISVVGQIDLVEAFNARNILARFNQQAQTFAERYHLHTIACSDSHFAGEVGRTFTMLAPFATPQEFVRSIAAGTSTRRASFPGYHLLSKMRKLLSPYQSVRMS